MKRAIDAYKLARIGQLFTWARVLHWMKKNNYKACPSMVARLLIETRGERLLVMRNRERAPVLYVCRAHGRMRLYDVRRKTMAPPKSSTQTLN